MEATELIEALEVVLALVVIVMGVFVALILGVLILDELMTGFMMIFGKRKEEEQNTNEE